MRATRTLGFLVGSALTYLAFACGSAAVGSGTWKDAGAFIDDVFDAARDPVSDAVAGPAAATYEVSDEGCTDSGGTGFATHAYPGKSAAELASEVTAVYLLKPGYTLGGHTWPAIQSGGLLIDDGLVGSICPSQVGGAYENKVRFILRQ
jgi:hypothetical protein